MSANLAWLVGHNTLRSIAGIKGPDYTPEQYQVMERGCVRRWTTARWHEQRFGI